jgi:hypothetical protein
MVTTIITKKNACETSLLTGHSYISGPSGTVSILVVCQSGDLLLVGGPIKEVHNQKKPKNKNGLDCPPMN